MSPRGMSSVELPADRSGFVRGGVQVEIEVRRIIEYSVNLVLAGVNATGDGVVVTVEVGAVEQINPMSAVVATRCVVEMKSGHRTVEPVPGDVKAHSFLPGVEIETGDTLAVVVPAIFKLVTIELHEELLMAVAVRRGGLMRRCRDRPGEHQD
jgi:hypothetical protein